MIPDEQMDIDIRPDIDEYYIAIACAVSKRSTCIRLNVGAVIVEDKHILSTGYNGTPSGMTHCTEIGCLRDELNIPHGTQHEKCRSVHAEMSAISQAAYHGIKTKGATLYCTHQPCILCAKLIINSGIKRVVYKYPYPDGDSPTYFVQAGIEVVQLK